MYGFLIHCASQECSRASKVGGHFAFEGRQNLGAVGKTIFQTLEELPHCVGREKSSCERIAQNALHDKENAQQMIVIGENHSRATHLMLLWREMSKQPHFHLAIVSKTGQTLQ